MIGRTDPVSIWTAEYFGNKDLAGAPTYTEASTNIHSGNFSRNWGTGAPPNTPADNFSGRMKTDQYFAPGSYKISVSSDDGVRLWIGGQLIIDQWTDTAGDYSNYFTSSGAYYPVTIEYKENGGAASLNYTFAPETPPSGYYGELSSLNEGQWDQQSGDDNQFEANSPFGGGDQRWKTDDRIEQIYTDLSNTIFGYRVSMNTGYAYDQSYHDYYGTWHAGLDMGAANGATIKAAIGGSVAWISGSGDGYVFVGINCDDGRQWVYGHLKSSSGLWNGKRINAGDTVGIVGALNHLHLEVENGHAYGGTQGAMTNQNTLLNVTVSPLMAYWQWRNR